MRPDYIKRCFRRKVSNRLRLPGGGNPRPVLLVELHDTRPCVLISNLKRTFGTQTLEAVSAQDSKPFVIIGEQLRALDCLQARQTGAFSQPVNQQTGYRGSIHSRQAGDLKEADRSHGPPGGGGDEAFYRTASRRRQQPNLRTQPHVAEEMKHSFDFRGSRLAYRRLRCPSIAHHGSCHFFSPFKPVSIGSSRPCRMTRPG